MVLRLSSNEVEMEMEKLVLCLCVTNADEVQNGKRLMLW